jgi:hypothetical protein
MFKPAIAAAIAGALLVSMPSHGQTIDRQTIDIGMTTRHESPYTDQLRDALSRLDELRDGGGITLVDYQRVRNELVEAKALGRTLPLDHRGRVDIEMMIAGVDPKGKTRGEAVLLRMLNRIEQRMQLTARDFANPDTRYLVQAPGYKEIDFDQIRDLVKDALFDMPLDALPLGDELASVIARLPSGNGVQASMSINQISEELHELPDAVYQRTIAPLIAGHEVEAAILALTAVTGLRAASPQAAAWMDRAHPRVTIFHKEDGSLGGKLRLAWRDKHVLPDLDLVGTASTTVGLAELYGELGATIAPLEDRRARGTVTIGARSHGENFWVDTAVTKFDDERRPRGRLMVGGSSNGVAYATGLTSANGVVQLEIDIAKPIRTQAGSGSIGFYAAVSRDGTTGIEDRSAGFVLNFRW